jgi:hypothetical protein
MGRPFQVRMVYCDPVRLSEEQADEYETLAHPASGDCVRLYVSHFLPPSPVILLLPSVRFNDVLRTLLTCAFMLSDFVDALCECPSTSCLNWPFNPRIRPLVVWPTRWTVHLTADDCLYSCILWETITDNINLQRGG